MEQGVSTVMAVDTNIRSRTKALDQPQNGPCYMPSPLLTPVNLCHQYRTECPRSCTHERLPVHPKDCVEMMMSKTHSSWQCVSELRASLLQNSIPGHFIFPSHLGA